MRKAWGCHVVLAGVLASSGAAAEPMAKEACEAASTERAALLTAGIQETVKKGPDWAKANLPPQKLKEVERFIGLQEILLFRCGEAKLRALPHGAEGEDAAEGQAVAKDVKPPGSPEQPPIAKRKPVASKPPPKKAAVPPGAEPIEAGAAAKPAAKAQPKPKPKPKVDDAYRPPKAPGQAGVQ